MTVPVAFYAPLKSPDHPSPSGDRTAGRLLLKALGRAGYAATVASRVRAYEPAGDPDRQAAIRDEARREAARLAAAYRAMPPTERPRLWFTYHCHYKAPDWIGPAVADALGIPYVIAEGSRARKRAGGPWALAHEGAEAALDRADLLFAVTDHDAEALRRDRQPHQRVVDLPPFLDLDDWPPHPRVDPAGSTIRLLAVGMMREGDKLASYRLLAAALTRVRAAPSLPLAGTAEPKRSGGPGWGGGRRHRGGSSSVPPIPNPSPQGGGERGGDEQRHWTLDIVGDGATRAQVEAAFASFSDQVTFHGEVGGRPRLAALYAEADLLVWPAVNEAYGMALMEAQSLGCPVLAGRYGGVASAVRDGVTGVLVPPGDVDAFAASLSDLLRDRARLRTLGGAASAFVLHDRHLDGAAAILRSELARLGPETLAA